MFYIANRHFMTFAVGEISYAQKCHECHFDFQWPIIAIQKLSLNFELNFNQSNLRVFQL